MYESRQASQYFWKDSVNFIYIEYKNVNFKKVIRKMEISSDRKNTKKYNFTHIKNINKTIPTKVKKIKNCFLGLK